MGDMNGEPLYCPLCGTLPSALDDPRRICPSCDQSMKEIRWLNADDIAALRQVIDFLRNHGEILPSRTTKANLDRLAALIGDDND
jgi:hypothetical protein